MARYKDTKTATWTGEALKGENEVTFVLRSPDDPRRRILFSVAPTYGRRMRRLLEEMLQRAGDGVLR